MTSIRPDRWLLTMGPWMVVLLGGLCGGCKPTPPAQDSGGVPDTALTVTPPDSQAPSRPTACKLPSNPEELVACRRGLEFEKLEVAGDEQRLMLHPPCPGKCTYGPLATIRPEKNSHLGREEDLSKGRIIAQLFLNEGEQIGYDKLGLSPGDTTYWWVQKVPGRSEGKSAYLTITGGKLVVKDTFTFRYESYRGATAPGRALARWLWDANDEKTQGTCPGGTCK
jgi:hypothetical protein